MVTDEQVQHPHHPWQSWRERWVKNLSLRRRPNLPVDYLQSELESEAAPGTSAESPEPVEPVEPAMAPKSRHRIPKDQPSEDSPSKSLSINKANRRGRNFFTKEEDKLLLKYIREAQEHDYTAIGKRVKSLSGNKIYQQFAEEVSYEIHLLCGSHVFVG